MKATTLTSIQFTSLLLIIGCAEGALNETLPTIIFALSFAAFALCSIHIARHEKELIRDIDRQYGEKSRLYKQ